MTPLHLAAYYGSLEGVRILLEAGARPNEITTDETTTLFLGDTSFPEISQQPLNGEKLVC